MQALRMMSQFLQFYGSPGREPFWLSKLHILGVHLSDAYLKSRGANIRIKPLAMQEEALSFGWGLW